MKRYRGKLIVREYLCASKNKFTFSSMLHTHTHNNEICSGLPFSLPLITTSCGLQKMARLEVCWDTGTNTPLVELKTNPDLLHGSVRK